VCSHVCLCVCMFVVRETMWCVLDMLGIWSNRYHFKTNIPMIVNYMRWYCYKYDRYTQFYISKPILNYKNGYSYIFQFSSSLLLRICSPVG